MPVISCSSCQKKLSVKDELAGKMVKCPGCGQIVQVPAAAAVPAAGQSRTVPPAAARNVNPPQPARPQLQDQATVPPPGVADATQSSKSDVLGHDASLTDFLAPAQRDDELGRLGGFRILKILGHGGMGVVFQGEDATLSRKVAIKAMLPHLAGSKSSQERFLREARSAAALEHDHIVPIFHVGQDRGAPFIVMPFLKGESLEDRLQRQPQMPVAEVIRIGREAAEGLAAAHAAGLIHRDIKPANIWLEAPKDRAKILDFGLARDTQDEAGLTQQGAVIGTPAYMPPEQGRGDAVDGRCDLWSLGVVLYRMCTGHLPFVGADTVATLIAVAMNEPPPPHAVNPHVPAGLSQMVMQLLVKDPARRIASAQEVVDALRRLVQAQPVLVGPPGSSATGMLAAAPSAVRPAPGSVATGTWNFVNQRAASPPRKNRTPLLIAVGAGGLALVAAIIAAVVIFWPTPNGLVRIESDDPNVVITFGKNGPTITGASKEPISLRSGDHGLIIQRGDFSFETDKLLVQSGKTITLKVELIKGNLQVAADGKIIGSKKLPGGDMADPGSKGSSPNGFKNKLGMEFVLVPKGKSWLGGGGGKPGNKEVEFRQDFYMGAYPVTQEEWHKVMGNNPSYHSRTGDARNQVKDVSDEVLKGFPVEMVSWFDCQEFIRRLNDLDKKSGWEYRIPTDEEWEYACRGGPMKDKATSAWDFYVETPTNELKADQANFNRNVGRPSKVGNYKPNSLGLYDMHGNVGQWVSFGTEYAGKGGGFVYEAAEGRAAHRRGAGPGHRGVDLGLRLVRVPIIKTPPPPGLIAYLSDLKGLDWKGEGIFGKNGRVGDGVDAIAIFVRGARSPKGLWMHPPDEGHASITYNLDGLKAKSLRAKVAINDSSDGSGSPLKFQVLGDGTVLWTSEPIQASRKPQDCVVDVDGVHLLELRVLCPSTKHAAHAVWVDPFLSSIAANEPVKPPVGDDVWLKEVAAMPTAKQVDAVTDRLKELNPGFADKLAPTVKGGKVTGLQFVSDKVRNLAPLQAFPELDTLDCTGSPGDRRDLDDLSALKGLKLTKLYCGNSRVADLSPRKGMPLTHLYCGNTPVADLSPVKDMPLTHLHVASTPVSSLEPIKEMKLEFLDIGASAISDLTPVKGMKLREFHSGFAPIADLTPLKGMDLTELQLGHTKVSNLSALKGMKLTGLDIAYTRIDDLTPLQDMPLRSLNCSNSLVADLKPVKGMKLISLSCADTKVADLSPLVGMPLEEFTFGATKVLDLSPLKGMPLRSIMYDFEPARDRDILRSIKTLQQINGMSAATLLK